MKAQFSSTISVYQVKNIRPKLLDIDEKGKHPYKHILFSFSFLFPCLL